MHEVGLLKYSSYRLLYETNLKKRIDSNYEKTIFFLFLRWFSKSAITPWEWNKVSVKGKCGSDEKQDDYKFFDMQYKLILLSDIVMKVWLV